ncbi:MAG: DUF4982 domain-containing protein [Clostridia bacterium]|nr:DUF4982 domain-containing protein [Clostridia bacterium]
MKQTNFSENWTINGETVTLPRDEMLSAPRTPQSPSGSGGAFFTGGVYEYKKCFTAPDAPVCLVEFEGAYRETEIVLNGEKLAENLLGNVGFTVDLSDKLRRGEPNELCVTVRNDRLPNARWYTGSGICRPVHLWTGERTHIAFEGVRVSTPACAEDVSEVKVETTILHRNTGIEHVRLITELVDEDGKPVSVESTPVTLFPGENPTIAQRLYPRNVKLWSVETPHLYICRVRLSTDTPQTTMEVYAKAKAGVLPEETTLDTAETVFGIRHIQIDPVHGLRINGVETKLRGACIHADNGVLGAAEYDGAALFRVKRLKEAGFNAVRIAHQPASKALLSACDRVGMLLMEETFDYWTDRKSAQDDADRFEAHWRELVAYTVQKDFNHPCVLLYSIGNEIMILHTDEGRRYSRLLSDEFRRLDPTRPVTNAANAGMSIGTDRIAMLYDMGLLTQDVIDRIAGKANATLEEMGASVKRLMASGNINDLMTLFTGKMNDIVAHPVIAARMEEVYSHLDCCGYNYMMPCYETDTQACPNRVIFGSETNPPRIDALWAYVQKDPANLGDFCWTGWDYLGEVGVGITSYDGVGRFAQPYPALLAYCGDVDLTGYRRPLSYFRELVFGLRKAPYLSVALPAYYGVRAANTPWAVTETVHSWTWRGFEGKPIHVEIYTAGDEIVLLQDGTEVGRAKPEGYRAGFDLCYRPGTLEAIAYANGTEFGRDVLQTAAGRERVSARTERCGELTYVELQITDENGVFVMDREYTLSLETDAVLLGFGSGDPWSEEPFTTKTHTTYRGRALAIVRTDAIGAVTIKAESLPEEKVVL